MTAAGEIMTVTDLYDGGTPGLSTSMVYAMTSGSVNATNASVTQRIIVNTTRDDEELQLFDKPLWHLVLIGFIYGVLVVMTVVGNIFVMVAYHRDVRIRRSVANTFILNLAIADFVVGAFIWPVYLAWNLAGVWVFGEYLCKVWSFVDYTVTAVSVVTIIFISLDRYWLLSKASAYASFQTQRRVNVTIAICWLLIAAVFAIIIFGWSTFVGTQSVDFESDCDADFVYSLPSLISVVVLNFVVPAVIIAVLNVAVYYKIRERARGLSQLRSKIKRESANGRELSKSPFWMRLNVFKKHRDCELPVADTQGSGLKTDVILLSVKNVPAAEYHSNPGFEPKAGASPPSSSDGTSGICSAREAGSVASIDEDDDGDVPTRNNVATDNFATPANSSETGQNVYSVSPPTSPKGEPVLTEQQDGSPTRATRSLNLDNLKKKLKQKQREFNRERRAAVILAVLVGVFVLCWLPFNLTVVVGVLCNYRCITENNFLITENLVWANSALNPFLYAATNVHYRRNFLSFLGCHRLANNMNGPVSGQ